MASVQGDTKINKKSIVELLVTRGHTNNSRDQIWQLPDFSVVSVRSWL